MTLTSPFVIELTEAERRGLEQVADSRAAPFGQVQRASVILAVADGMSNAAAARAAGRHVDTVRAWRKRFAAERLAALTDRPRPLGRPAWRRRTSCGSSPPRPRPRRARTRRGPTGRWPATCGSPGWRSPPPRSAGS